MAQYTLAAKIREEKGKEAAKKLRKEQKVPAVFYGPKSDSLMLTVEYSALRKIMKNISGENIILGLQIESDKGSDSKLVMLKELQTDFIKDTYIHADFYEISMDQELVFDIPIRFVNTPLGVKNGGMLQHVRREVSISCLPDKLMDYIEVDVSGLDIGESLHVKDINFPDGVNSLLEGHIAIATVIAPAIATEEKEEGEEGEATETEEKAELETE